MSKLFDEIMQSYNDIVSMKNETTQDKVDRMLFINDINIALDKIKRESEHYLDEIFKNHVYKYLKDIGFESCFTGAYDEPDYGSGYPYDFIEYDIDQNYLLNNEGKYYMKISTFSFEGNEELNLLELTFCPVTLEIEVHHNEFER